jgi:hypothetical protein
MKYKSDTKKAGEAVIRKTGSGVCHISLYKSYQRKCPKVWTFILEITANQKRGKHR